MKYEFSMTFFTFLTSEDIIKMPNYSYCFNIIKRDIFINFPLTSFYL